MRRALFPIVLSLLACGPKDDARPSGSGGGDDAPLRALPDDPRFTVLPFDPAQVAFVTPLGTVATGGETKNRHQVHVRAEIAEAPILAPADGYIIQAHFDEVPGSVPYFGVDVQVGKGVVVSLDHLAFPADEIRSVLPASGQREVRPPFKVTAGQRIGRVQPARPNAAYAMDLVTTDERNENPFVNRERFRSSELRAFLVGVCFERFLDPARVPALAALYGEGRPVPGTGCGNASRDVPSALAGMWFLDAPGEGEYGERFAIARLSNGEVRMNMKDAPGATWIFDVRTAPVDPASVRVGASQCYLEDIAPPASRFAFLRVTGESTVDVALGVGACPAAFPAAFKTYRR